MTDKLNDESPAVSVAEISSENKQKLEQEEEEVDDPKKVNELSIINLHTSAFFPKRVPASIFRPPITF